MCRGGTSGEHANLQARAELSVRVPRSSSCLPTQNAEGPHFTLIGDELEQLRNKGATRLGFAVLLKFLLWRGRFPRGLDEVSEDAVAARRYRPSKPRTTRDWRVHTGFLGDAQGGRQ